MRWEQLFDDLEAQFDALEEAELRAELADRERVASGAVTMASRLAGAVGGVVRVRTTGGAVDTGRVVRVGPDWLLLEPAAGAQLLVSAAAVTLVEGLDRHSGPPLAGVLRKLDLRHMIRGLVRDRAPVALRVIGTDTELTGTLDRVGADFLELAQHPAWEPRRAAAVRSVATIPLPAVAVVRSMPLG